MEHTTDPTRRRLLAGAALASLPLAGCLEGSPTAGASDDEDGEDENATDGTGDEPTEEDGADDGTETDTPDEDDAEDEEGSEVDAGGDALAGYETLTYSTPSGETRAEALFSASDVDRAIEFDRLDEETVGDVEAFVEATDFERAKLVLLAVRAPDLCYGIDLEELTADADGVTVRARAVDDSGADEMCAQAEHVPTILLRVVFEEGVEVPGSGSIGLVDAQGREHGIGYDSASESVSADGGAGEPNEEAGGEGSNSRDDGDEAGDDA